MAIIAEPFDRITRRRAPHRIQPRLPRASVVGLS
jgi:hypothetical protein